MGLGYVDTHCHLVSDHFEADAVEVARRCLAAGVRMLAVSADVPGSYRSLLLAEELPGIRAGVGVHPTAAGSLDEVAWDEIVHLAGQERVAAVGETGLDYYWKDCPPETQKIWFRKHIELALALGKPLSVHARDSVRDTLAMLEPYFADGLRLVWHCFTAGKKDIDWALEFAIEHGVYLGIGGLATYEDQKPLRQRIPAIPEELLLLETDAPYLVPRPKTMDRNEPTGVIRVAEALAALRGVTAEDIRRATTANADRLFGTWK